MEISRRSLMARLAAVTGAAASTAVADAPAVAAVALDAPPKEAPDVLDAIRAKADELAEPFRQTDPDVEYAAWIDRVSDNILLKAYHIKEHFGLGAALTQLAIRTHGPSPEALAPLISETWASIAEAMRQRPTPEEWRTTEMVIPIAL